MANKDHSLDEPILRAAMAEFLEKGFEKASLRKIAASAGVTIGAIYTRWPTKNLLLLALTEPLLNRITEEFQRLRRIYDEADGPGDLLNAMREETDGILHLLLDDRERASLLLCRSAGSSLEGAFDQILEEKIRGTEQFFRDRAEDLDPRVLRLLIGAQFNMYRQVVAQGWNAEDARSVMDRVMVYHSGGWRALLKLEQEEERTIHEV